MKIKFLPFLFFSLLLFTGCSSIVDGGPKTVKINSNPSGAKFTVFDKEGKSVDAHTTPASIRLKRAHGYFNAEDYKLIFEAPGFYPSEVHVKSTVDGWYFGNILFGGLIGMVFVDPATGAMYTLPKEVNRNLVSSEVFLSPEALKAAETKANPPPAHKSAAKSGKDNGN